MTEYLDCQTAACFAGYTAIVSGFTQVIRFNDVIGLENPKTGEQVVSNLSLDFPSVPDIECWAMEKLDLNRSEMNELFNRDNTLIDIETIVFNLCDDPFRSNESKQLLMKTLHRVWKEDSLGHFDQTEWLAIVFN